MKTKPTVDSLCKDGFGQLKSIRSLLKSGIIRKTFDNTNPYTFANCVYNPGYVSQMLSKFGTIINVNSVESEIHRFPNYVRDINTGYLYPIECFKC